MNTHKHTWPCKASVLLVLHLTAVPTSLATGYFMIFYSYRTDCKYRYGMCWNQLTLTVFQTPHVALRHSRAVLHQLVSFTAAQGAYQVSKCHTTSIPTVHHQHKDKYTGVVVILHLMLSTTWTISTLHESLTHKHTKAKTSSPLQGECPLQYSCIGVKK